MEQLQQRIKKEFEAYQRESHCVNQDFWAEVEAYSQSCGRMFADWMPEDLYGYLRSKKFKTYLTALQYISMVTGFVAFLHKKGYHSPSLAALGNIHMDTFAPEKYIDFQYVLSFILNVSEYEQLKSYFGRNVRDRLILELSWVGLTSREIMGLTCGDIKIQGRDGARYALIHTPANVFRTYDECTIDDLIDLPTITEHVVETSHGILRRLPYAEDGVGDGMYLIRNATIRKKAPGSTGGRRALIRGMFENVLKTIDRPIGQINLSELSIKDIRKSRIVYLLSRPDADRREIQRQFQLQPSVVRFYCRLAEYKYANRKTD